MFGKKKQQESISLAPNFQQDDLEEQNFQGQGYPIGQNQFPVNQNQFAQIPQTQNYQNAPNAIIIKAEQAEDKKTNYYVIASYYEFSLGKCKLDQ